MLSALVDERLARYADVQRSSSSAGAGVVDLAVEEARLREAEGQAAKETDAKKLRSLRAKIGALQLRLSELRILSQVQKAANLVGPGEKEDAKEPEKKKQKK